MLERFESKFVPEPNSGCWLWTACYDDGGYGIFTVGGHRGSNKKAHRVAWELYRSPIPADMQVLHKCDVRCCVNPDHLWLGTQAENVADCMAKGRNQSVVGENNNFAKLSEQDAKFIKENCSGTPQDVGRFAARYGVRRAAISALLRGATWKHL